MALALLFSSRVVRAQEPPPTQEPPAATPSEARFTATDVINVVNTLRTTNGIPALTVHPILMQVAAAEASGIAGGAGGHWRPENLTLGQWLLTLGYPLSGDLSLDGYRSENWFMASTSDELSAVTQFWQGDAEHRDTMFSEFRSDIGAAVVVGQDGQVYVVLETALRTPSGKMQGDAYPILTGIPATQLAFSQMGTMAAENGLLPQFSVPVALSTPGPDGNIYHEVQYGQTLWSIAIAYHTTIKEIQALNHLAGVDIRDGQKLLVVKDAKGAIRTSEPTEIPITPRATAAPRGTPTSTPQPTPVHSEQQDRVNALSLGAIAFAGLVLGGVFISMMRKKG